MKVILLDHIRAVGKVGDVKDVRDGYARNFLFPRNLARLASDGVIRDVEQTKAKKLAAYDLAQTQAAEVADKLKDAVVELKGTANEKGTLFAAIEPSQIAPELSTLAGVKIDANDINISEPIKTVGKHSATIDLTDEVSVSITIKVSKQ